VLALVAGIGLFLQVAMPGQPPPAQVTVHSDVTVNVPPPDPEATADMAAWSFSGIVVNVISPTMVKWANALLDVPDFVRTTPPDLSYKNDTVRELHDIVKKVTLALIGLSILSWAFTAIGKGDGSGYGKLVLGTALALGNLVWWEWGIRLNNGITNAINAPSLSSIAKQHLTVPEIASDPVQAFGPAVMVIATCIVIFLLVLAMFARLALIDVLIVSGALALFMKSSEHTERFASAYTSMATGTLFAQIMVVITLRLAMALGVVSGGIAGAILSLSILLLARKMPGILSSRFGQSSGSPAKSIGKAAVVVRRVVARI